MGERHIHKADGWLVASVGDQQVMMHQQHSNYVGLSRVGARIWDLLDTHPNIDALCSALVESYTVTPTVCRTEVEAFVEELARQGVVHLTSEDTTRP